MCVDRDVSQDFRRILATGLRERKNKIDTRDALTARAKCRRAREPVYPLILRNSDEGEREGERWRQKRENPYLQIWRIRELIAAVVASHSPHFFIILLRGSLLLAILFDIFVCSGLVVSF